MSDGKARILLWGMAGSGKSTTLKTIHAKLQPSLRGDIRQEPTSIDPTVHYEALPIQLGRVGGIESQLEIIAVPGATDQVMTRKQLLDEVDGIVLVLDCSPEKIEQNDQSISELRESLEAYGRALDDVPIVLQYNKRDIADPFEIENFHRRIGLDQAAVFETIATTGHGILSTLTTISKHVVRARRGQSTAAPEITEAPGETTGVVAKQAISEVPIEVAQPESTADGLDPALEATGVCDPSASSSDILEAAILAEGDALEADEAVVLGDAVEAEFPSSGIQPDWNSVAEDSSKPESILGAELRIVSAGTAEVNSEGGLRLPLVLGDDSGQTRSVVLSLRLDTLLDSGND